MSLPHARIIGNFIRKGVPGAFLIALGLASVDNSHGILQLVPIAHAAESGHSSHEEGGSCAGCGGEEGGEHGGGSHASGGGHGTRRGGEKGHGGGTHRGFGGAAGVSGIRSSVGGTVVRVTVTLLNGQKRQRDRLQALVMVRLGAPAGLLPPLRERGVHMGTFGLYCATHSTAHLS